MDEGLKIKGIKYLNVETRLLFAPPSKFLATRLLEDQPLRMQGVLLKEHRIVGITDVICASTICLDFLLSLLQNAFAV